MAAAIVGRFFTTTGSNSCCCISRSRYLLSNNHSSSSSYDYYYVQLLHFSTNNKPSPSIAPLQFNDEFFISKYKFSPQNASKIVSALARMKNPQNADLLLSFLKESGFSNAHLDRIVRNHTQLLSTTPEKSVKPKFKIFQDLGFSAAEATQVVARDLNILKCGANRIIHSLSVYRRLLGSNDNFIKLIQRCGSLLYADPEKTVLPNIQFLNQCGIQTSQINTLIYRLPYFLIRSPQNMRRCVRRVDEMGVDRTSKMFIYAAHAVSMMSDETLKIKLKSFQDMGFSQDDILRMFRRNPTVIAVSTRKLTEVKEVLLETGKYDMSCIIKCPISLTSSVEKNYKPRLQVLKVLEGKGIIKKWPGLGTLCKMSNKLFFDKFVAPNINEVGEDFIGKTGFSGKLETATGLTAKLR